MLLQGCSVPDGAFFGLSVRRLCLSPYDSVGQGEELGAGYVTFSPPLFYDRKQIDIRVCMERKERTRKHGDGLGGASVYMSHT